LLILLPQTDTACFHYSLSNSSTVWRCWLSPSVFRESDCWDCRFSVWSCFKSGAGRLD